MADFDEFTTAMLAEMRAQGLCCEVMNDEAIKAPQRLICSLPKGHHAHPHSTSLIQVNEDRSKLKVTITWEPLIGDTVTVDGEQVTLPSFK